MRPSVLGHLSPVTHHAVVSPGKAAHGGFGEFAVRECWLYSSKVIRIWGLSGYLLELLIGVLAMRLEKSRKMGIFVDNVDSRVVWEQYDSSKIVVR